MSVFLINYSLWGTIIRSLMKLVKSINLLCSAMELFFLRVALLSTLEVLAAALGKKETLAVYDYIFKSLMLLICLGLTI